MTPLQRAMAWVAVHDGITRDQFAQSRPLHQLDALIGKDYVTAHRDGTHMPTEAGHRFLNDDPV